MTQEDWQNENIHIESPKTDSIQVSISDVTWPADGLLVAISSEARISEGRAETTGIPVLSKIPYLGRWFTNVAIGRDFQTIHLIFTIQKVL